MSVEQVVIMSAKTLQSLLLTNLPYEVIRRIHRRGYHHRSAPFSRKYTLDLPYKKRLPRQWSEHFIRQTGRAPSNLDDRNDLSFCCIHLSKLKFWQPGSVLEFAGSSLEFYKLSAHVRNMRSRGASILNRSQPLQLLNIKIGMYVFPKSNTDIYHGRILRDQLFTIGDHMLRVPFGID